MLEKSLVRLPQFIPLLDVKNKTKDFQSFKNEKENIFSFNPVKKITIWYIFTKLFANFIKYGRQYFAGLFQSMQNAKPFQETRIKRGGNEKKNKSRINKSYFNRI